MVQQKNQRKPSILESLREQSEKFNKENPIIRSRWFVVEVTPAHNTGGYYDEDIPEKVVVVSPNFDTLGLAEDWLGQHEPDKGKFLKVRKQNLRRRTWTEWMNF